MKTLNTHTPILKFIEAYNLKETDPDRKLLKILDASYEFLTLLIWNNA
jgi:hypothetical protein